MNRFLVRMATRIATLLVCFNRVVTRSKPYQRLHTPIQPSISFRSPDSRRSSSRSSRYCTRSFGDLPKRGPFSVTLNGRFQCRAFVVRIPSYLFNSCVTIAHAQFDFHTEFCWCSCIPSHNRPIALRVYFELQSALLIFLFLNILIPSIIYGSFVSNSIKI